MKTAFNRAVHFTPPLEYLARGFGITWDEDAWGRDEDSRVVVGWPNYLPPQISVFSNSVHD